MAAVEPDVVGVGLGFKRLRERFTEVHRHHILNEFTAAIQAAVQQEVGVEFLPPTGKADTGDTVSLHLIYQGQLDEQQQGRLRRVLDRFSKPGG